METRLGRRAARGQIARHLKGAVDLGQDGSRRGDQRLGVDDRERRRVSGIDGVGQVGVAELGERVVADRQHPLGQALPGLDGEVPGLVEAAVDSDPGFLQRSEDGGVATLLRALRRRQPAARAQPREPRGRLDQLAGRRAQITQGDDERVPLGQQLPRMDQQIGVGRASGVGIELGPDQLPLTCGLVDQHDRLALGQRCRQVREWDRAGALQRGGIVQAPDVQHDGAAGTEAVVAVIRPGLDPHSLRVARHRRGRQTHP